MSRSGAGARRPRREGARSGFAGAWSGTTAAVLLALAAPAAAQLPWLDPLPAWSANDSLAHRTAGLEITRFTDERTGWAADRVLLDARLPAGTRGFFFVRLPWLRFDSGALAAVARWPQVAGPDAIAGWPGESVLTGFGQLELGVAGPLAVPGLGVVGGALAVGLPLGHSRFYPWSSAGLPVRLGLSRDFGPREGWALAVRAAVVRQGGPGTGEFADEAFPDGWQAGAQLGRRGSRLGTALAWDVDARGGRREQWLALALDLPWNPAGRVGLRVAREFSSSADHLAEWRAGLSWRLAPRAVVAAPVDAD